MDERCPVCGEPVEYREVVPAGDGDAQAATTIDVDELCAMDETTRWNRVCPVATPGDDAVRLELYRHHWGSTE